MGPINRAGLALPDLPVRGSVVARTRRFGSGEVGVAGALPTAAAPAPRDGGARPCPGSSGRRPTAYARLLPVPGRSRGDNLRLRLALALWNGRNMLLKERTFGQWRG